MTTTFAAEIAALEADTDTSTESLADWMRRRNVPEHRIQYYLTTELETRYYPTLNTHLTTGRRVPRQHPLTDDYTGGLHGLD